MFAGVFSLFSHSLAAGRGLLKVGGGMNPNQPFELRAWVQQFFQDLLQGGGGGSAMSDLRSQGQSDGARQAIIAQMNSRR